MIHPQILAFFKQNGWQAFDFQQDVWKKYHEGYSGLLNADTGTGKTLATWLAPINDYLLKAPAATDKTEPLRVLWITPLRALANDVQKALQKPVDYFKIPWTIETRTGDTSAAVRRGQKDRLPTCLITTPESISILLTRHEAHQFFESLKCVIVDEWHELLSSKRGVQTELCLARLKNWRPELRVWGMSATIGNLPQALEVLTAKSPKCALVKSNSGKKWQVKTLIPDEVERYPWAGHLGVRMLKPVAEVIEKSNSTLLFTNTRAQAEIWYQAILTLRPEWAGIMALHHGSLDKKLREFVESGLKIGQLKLVVATSSLDLGVDFSPVEQVIQVGSPKGIARIFQRAGRSGHQPGAVSSITCVPTNALELVEFAALREAMQEKKVEAREPLLMPMDLLAQHLITISIGGGFRRDEMLEEIRSTYSYSDLSDEAFDAALNFITNRNSSLEAYSEYARVTEDSSGIFRITNRQKARMHIMSIGSIVSDIMISVKLQNGKRLGQVEEGFVSRLGKGDCFVFSGRVLEFLRFREMACVVKEARAKKAVVPSYQGSRMPLSSELSDALRSKLDEASRQIYQGAELLAAEPVFENQREVSIIPRRGELLIEQFKSREGYHIFIFPFEGRLVHEGLMALFAFRIGRLQARSFSMACNDYGFELLSDEEIPLQAALEHGLFSTTDLADDIRSSMNSSEMARRQFREVARVAGLIFQGYPGAPVSNKNLQAHSGLIFDVLRQYDAQNIMLQQAEKEVMQRQLEISRLARCLERISNEKLKIVSLERPGPLGFPIMVDRLNRDRVSSESVEDFIEKMIRMN